MVTSGFSMVVWTTKEELNIATTVHGEPFAMQVGRYQMLQWSVLC